MPFINIKTSVHLSDGDVTSLKSELGQLISVFPGKSESWLMCEIESGRKLFFQGSDAPCAFAEVKLFGAVSDSASENFTKKLCSVLEKYNIEPGRVYVRYEGGTSWGWNGSNF